MGDRRNPALRWLMRLGTSQPQQQQDPQVNKILALQTSMQEHLATMVQTTSMLNKGLLIDTEIMEQLDWDTQVLVQEARAVRGALCQVSANGPPEPSRDSEVALPSQGDQSRPRSYRGRTKNSSAIGKSTTNIGN